MIVDYLPLCRHEGNLAGEHGIRSARMLRDVADNGLAAVPDRQILHGDGGLAMELILGYEQDSEPPSSAVPSK